MSSSRRDQPREPASWRGSQSRRVAFDEDLMTGRLMRVDGLTWGSAYDRNVRIDWGKGMTGSEFIACVYPYLAVGLFVAGTARQFVRWLRMPTHVKWTLHPVPKGLAGQLKYMVKEIFTFETLYRFNRRLWVGTFCMHMAMLGAVVFLILNLIGWTQGFPVR